MTWRFRISNSTAARPSLAIALLGFALTGTWPLLLGFGFLAGPAGGAIDAGLNAFGARHFSARVLNWLHAFFGMGTTLGPLIVTAVLTAGHAWPWSYVIVGNAQLLPAAIFFVYAGSEFVVAQWSFTLLTLHRGEGVASVVGAPLS